MKMKPILPLALVLALASPALAIDWPIFLGHYDPEYAGVVDHWPNVVRTRQLAKLCPPQQYAIIERDKAALEARTPSIYGPAFGRAMPSVSTNAPAPASPGSPETTPTPPPGPILFPSAPDETPKPTAPDSKPRP